MEFKNFFVYIAFVLLVAVISEGSRKRLNLFPKQKRSAQVDTFATFEEGSQPDSVDWCNSPYINYEKFTPRFLELYCP